MLASGLRPNSDPKLSELFHRVVDTVYTYELQAFRAGDGFQEAPAVPAPIDEVAEMTFPVDPRLKDRAEEAAKNISHDLPLTVNDEVLSFLNFFQTPARPRHRRSRACAAPGRYREMIARVLREEGVPQDLIYLAQAESAFQPLALSRAGARGMWQFVAYRGQQYGLRRTWWIDERQDPEKATRAAAQHLRDLYGLFGDWYLAMAAYNCGPGNVQKGIERTGYADFWELYRRNVLPKETKNYVPIILALTLIAKDAAALRHAGRPGNAGCDRCRKTRPRHRSAAGRGNDRRGRRNAALAESVASAPGHPRRSVVRTAPAGRVARKNSPRKSPTSPRTNG